MVNAIGAIGGRSNLCDPEYIKILQELRQLGITPSGNKQVDKAKLEAEKAKIAEKIQDKMDNKPVQTDDNSSRKVLEEQRIGAMTVAELNKILHGLM